jgi:hypothetical protein
MLRGEILIFDRSRGLGLAGYVPDPICNLEVPEIMARHGGALADERCGAPPTIGFHNRYSGLNH